MSNPNLLTKVIKDTKVALANKTLSKVIEANKAIALQNLQRHSQEAMKMPSFRFCS